MPSPVRTVICFVDQDVSYLNALELHLKPYQNRGEVELWTRLKLPPGESTSKHLAELRNAQVALVLVSPDLLASESFHTQELPELLQRARQKKVILLPVLIRPTNLNDHPLEKLQALPEPSRSQRDDAPRKWREAPLYQPHEALTQAIELAIALQHPLLLTGAPGCGKTTAAYWAAWRMHLKPSQLIHAQVRSDSTAARFKYEFDIIRYHRDSHLAALRNNDAPTDWARYIQPGPLWRAFAESQLHPVVLLIDEIDKAPRDFPNDLLREFEELAFDVPDWPLPDGKPKRIEAASPLQDRGLRLIICTSNAERSLPDAFLRRCIHHHLSFDRDWLRALVDNLRAQNEIKLPQELLNVALTRFLGLQARPRLAHKPGLGELLVWLRVLELLKDLSPQRLTELPLHELPYLGTLLKDPEDLKRISPSGTL